MEIDRDSVAAIERAVEEATRTAMRSADARSVVGVGAGGDERRPPPTARRELKAELEASCGRLVTELTNRTKDERDERSGFSRRSARVSRRASRRESPRLRRRHRTLRSSLPDRAAQAAMSAAARLENEKNSQVTSGATDVETYASRRLRPPKRACARP